MTTHDVSIRPAGPADAASVWQTLEPTIRSGETSPLPQDMTQADALAYWFAPGNEVFVAHQAGTIVGTYFLRPNHGGGGAHVASSVYVVSPSATGRGIAQVMCEHSLVRARERGFLGMQLNFVVSSDERRIKLWERAGFEVVGRLPKAFRHPSQGLIDALVMYRTL
jgi:ribosomal protein S18 acetylase RimI-like enzyme